MSDFGESFQIMNKVKIKSEKRVAHVLRSVSKRPERRVHFDLGLRRSN